jgi:ribonuclease R
MDIDQKGHIVGHKICETVINVDRRMSYTSVSAIVEDHDPGETRKYEELVPMFEMMLHVSDLLRANRRKRGSIDFDFDESKIKIDSDGKVVSIGVYERRRSNEIIEDFMLAANETIAEDYFWQDIPFEYRVHETPDADRVEQLALLISNFGMYFKASKENIHPKEFQKLLDRIKGEPYENLVSRMALRTMKQAKYTTECSGHFGLAAKYYCHFTSPIRRYPDLQIHRIIKDKLRGRLEREGKTEHYKEILEDVARQSSVCERRADEAERESDKLKKAEYMSYHIGEEFEGIISGVTGWGFYVELPNTVEGLVHVNTLRDDYYTFDQDAYELIGDVTHKVFALGQKVRVRVADADTMLKTVDFVLAEEQEW